MSANESSNYNMCCTAIATSYSIIATLLRFFQHHPLSSSHCCWHLSPQFKEVQTLSFVISLKVQVMIDFVSAAIVIPVRFITVAADR